MLDIQGIRMQTNVVEVLAEPGHYTTDVLDELNASSSHFKLRAYTAKLSDKVKAKLTGCSKNAHGATLELCQISRGMQLLFTG
jgi:hypothetical protein